MVIFQRQLIVSVLVLLQLVAPLLHAHSGMELSNDRLHLPGLETINIDLPEFQILEAVTQEHDSGIVVGICAGIKQVSGISKSDTDTPFILSEMVLTSSFHSVSKPIYFPINRSLLNQSGMTNLSRAPPLSTS